MNTIQYKSFEIVERNGGSFRVMEGGSPAGGFKLEGYATLNNAKGAITKHINAIQKQVRADPEWGLRMGESLVNLAEEQQREAPAKAKAATSDDKSRASAPTSGAELASPARSRNKREGQYIGVADGKHERATCRNGGSRALFSRTSGYYQPTRKARKAAKMEVLNSTRQGAHGGYINPKF